jgi:hypothetical protein
VLGTFQVDRDTRTLMNDEVEELEPGQTDEIGRRMADIIEEQDDEVTEHVDPHWEVFYDDDHEEVQRIVHLHDGEKVEAELTQGSDGSSQAKCSECGATLDIAKGKGKRGEASAVIG